MLKKINNLLSTTPMTIVAGAFLILSLILILAGIRMPFDLAWVTVIISGLPMAYLALTRLIYQKWISSALLITIAMIASIIIGEIFAAGEIAFIMAIGALLEDKTVAKARSGISKLIKLVPTLGRKLVKDNGVVIQEMVPLEILKVGELLRVLPGEIIPVDGFVVFGSTTVDQSIVTGESLPIDKSIGDMVYCGTINCHGSIDIEVTQTSKDSSLQKMIDLVKKAENNKAPMQKIVDKWATWLVPIALLIALATYAATLDIVKAVTILVVFCPCALALATPTSVVAAIGQAAKHGVLIKSGEALEKMGEVNCIAFDKTGTLTLGLLEVSELITFSQEISEDDLLYFTASAELRSEHPVAKAIVREANARNISLAETEEFQMTPGKGVMAIIGGNEVVCGNNRYLGDMNIFVKEVYMQKIDFFTGQGKIAVVVAKNKNCIGAVILSDKLRQSANKVVKKLKQSNVSVVLLTGDNINSASYIASNLGIDDIRAELLPLNKVEVIEDLIKNGRRVAMVGDGINDAAALKTADVGIALGGIGSNITVEAADIALVSNDIESISYLRNLSSSTLKTIKGNITASMALNFIAIVLSIVGVLNPITGAIVHNAGSVLVVLNAALLYDRKFA